MPVANEIDIPYLNPVKFYDVTRANLSKYYTKAFDDFMFSERQYYWQQPADYRQIWQTTDIIYLQFESTFDPIIVELKNQYGVTVIPLISQAKLPNKFKAGFYSYEISMSLSGIPSGCYYLQITAGVGVGQKIYISGKQYISSVQIENSICIEYFNSRFHGDIIFETGIIFQHRIYGSIGFMEPGRNDSFYRNQRNTPQLLNSKVSRQFPVFFGDQFGIPDDTIDLINRIWSCDNVAIDGKAFCLADNSKFEFVTVAGYTKRGLKLTVEEGINRNSKMVIVDTDTTKKLMTSIIVDAAVFGDTSNNGSSNAVPVYNISE